MPHGASGPSGAFLIPADLGGMGKLTGFPNAFTMSFFGSGDKGMLLLPEQRLGLLLRADKGGLS